MKHALLPEKLSTKRGYRRCSCGKTRNTLRSLQRHIKEANRGVDNQR